MRLRYIGLGVDDLDTEATFLGDIWQLEPAGEDAGCQLYTTPGAVDPFIVRVRPALENRVDVFGFALPGRSDVDQLHRELLSHGAEVVEPPAELEHAGGGYGFRAFDPDGHLLEFATDVPLVEPRDGEPGNGQPLSLSHYVINSTDNEALAAWYCAHLGFRVTDRLEDKLIFLTTSDVHHQIAIGSSDENGLNHIAYECGDIDEFMRATGRVQRLGRRLLWGPGRHGPGDNTYAYFRDPAGFIQEFTTGLELVSDPNWTVRTWESVPEQSDLWGTSNPRPNDEFAGRRDPGLGIVPGHAGER